MKKNSRPNKKLTINSETLKFISGSANGGICSVATRTGSAFCTNPGTTVAGSANCPESAGCPTEGCPG
jgi:hypothetical protein